MRLADISWPSGRERAAECIPGPTERTFVYRLCDKLFVCRFFYFVAGVCENRTHPRGYKPLAPVLKTGGPTRTHLPPYTESYIL